MFISIMDLKYISYFILIISKTQKKHVYVEHSEHIIKFKTFAYSLQKVLCNDFVHVYMTRDVS